MLAKLAALKVNFLIVFFGAPFIIFLIKLTPLLLPPKYYFNFSKLIAFGSEPFIVDPPGITGEKLCELMSEHHISQKSFNRLISCTQNFEESETKSADRSSFSREEVDEIYTLALHTDPAARSAIVEAAKWAEIEPLTDNEVRRFAANETEYLRPLSTDLRSLLYTGVVPYRCRSSRFDLEAVQLQRRDL